MSTNKVVSNNTVRRLPKYLRKLDELSESGITRISSLELGEMLGMTASQIRQDLSTFGEFGHQGIGYQVQTLRDAIAQILGIEHGYRAVLVGTGNIGRALMDKFSFEDWGFRLEAAFDINPGMIGKTLNGVPVLDASTLESYLQQNQVDVAVLCVPLQHAADTAKRLISCGIDAIWNFTNADITEPDSRTIVENIHFSDSLMALSYYLTNRNNKAGK